MLLLPRFLCALPQRLRKKLENYFQYRCTQAADHDYAQLLLHQMVPSLQQEVSLYTDSKWLAKLPVFAEAPPALISKVWNAAAAGGLILASFALNGSAGSCFRV